MALAFEQASSPESKSLLFFGRQDNGAAAVFIIQLPKCPEQVSYRRTHEEIRERWLPALSYFGSGVLRGPQRSLVLARATVVILQKKVCVRFEQFCLPYFPSFK